MPAFAARLRRLRESAGLTQEELAERAGLTAKGISALERGDRRHPYPATVRAIAEALTLDAEQRAALIATIPSRTGKTHGQTSDDGRASRATWPPEASPLIGRADEVALLSEQMLLADVRLLTILGPGGVGKTRLATAASRGLLGHPAFPDGVWFVDLSPARTASVAVSVVARTLGVMDGATTASLEGLQAFLASRRMLVVLDNFEQVLTAAPDLGALIAAAPDTTFLVTSREPLRLRWERTLPIMPLAVPDTRHLPGPEALALIPAVSLFLERARASQPSFRLSAANAAAVAELCVRLDGLPLAIELVAARAAQLGPSATLERLSKRLPVPGPGLRDAPARHQSLVATLQWSLDLLDPPERSLFTRLAVFAGGWTLAAAEAIAAPGLVVLDALTSLADKSLIVVEHGDDEPRFRMLDTARSHALELLEASDDRNEVRLLHIRQLADVAESAAGILQGADQQRIVAQLEREDDNIRQALDWARRSGRDDAFEEALRLVGALGWYWFTHGYPREAPEWFDALLDEDMASDDSRIEVLRAKVLNAGGFHATEQGDYALAAGFHERALGTWRKRHDVSGLVSSLHGLGDTALLLRNEDRAERSYLEGLELATGEGSPADRALFGFHLGQLSWLLGRLDEAARYAGEALAVARAAANTTWPPYALFVLASVAHERGDVGQAGRLYREAISLAWEHHDRLGAGMALPGLAALAAREGDPIRSVRLAGAASALEETVGIWAFPQIRERHEQWQRTGERGLDPKRRAAAWQAGRGMTIDETMAHALEPPSGKVAPLGESHRFSVREHEVLELLVRGRSNRDIAQELFITDHTAKYHVSSLLNKLGASSRSEAAIRAISLGLVSPPDD